MCRPLAANGYAVPGVAGMVWTGTAIGDWTLSCFSGELHSVTFVFADGSIKTISSDESNVQDGGSRQGLPLTYQDDPPQGLAVLDVCGRPHGAHKAS